MFTRIVLLVGLCAGCGAAPVDKSNDIVVGALLPFTGILGATGINLEQALIMAVEAINKSSVSGRQIRLVSRDTHSQVTIGTKAAYELIDAGAVAVIGGESDELSEIIAPAFEAKQVVFISPGVSSWPLNAVSELTYWYRTTTSPNTLGTELAERAFADGVRKLAILEVGSDYSIRFSTAMADKFTGPSLGGTVVAVHNVSDSQTSYAAELREIITAAPDAILLVADPSTGATIVDEFAALESNIRPLWYLAPTLAVDGFVRNIPPGLLDGMVGVRPAVTDSGDRYATAFSQHWNGDAPLNPAYFYYDSMALLGMALASSSFTDGGRPDPASLRRAVSEAAKPTGTFVLWDGLTAGITQAAAGQKVYYAGLTGVLEFDSDNNRRQGTSDLWKIEGQQILKVTP